MVEITNKQGIKFTIEDGVLTSAEIPDGVTELIIPEDVVGIGDSAFMGCNLTGKLVIPDSVTMIGDYAFGYLL